MYRSVRRISSLKGSKEGVIFPKASWSWIQSLRNCSGVKEVKAETLKELPKEKSFIQFLQQKQEQARRSVLVEIFEYNHWENLLHICSSFGNINSVFHYESGKCIYVLVEMSKEEELENFFRHKNDSPVRFGNSKHFMQLSNNQKKAKPLPKNIKNKVILRNSIKTNWEAILKKEIKKIESVSNHIQSLYDNTKINDLGGRLRFLTCEQIRQLLSGLFGSCTVFPFGSSVNGFGINGCDLDLVVIPGIEVGKNTKYIYDEKWSNIPRETMQRHLILIYDLFKLFLEGSKCITCIKNARIPIIKLKQNWFGLDCDLSLYYTHGVSTSQMLFILSALDERIKPLIFTVRLWAKMIGIVNPYPGPTISNFSLTLLILFFLQQKNISLVPPWDIFPVTDKFLLNDNEVLQSLSKFEKNKDNSISLEKLLCSFFKFYANFNFKNNGLSLLSGGTLPNSYGTPLSIQNPLLPALNVSMNVSHTELCKFQDYCSIASDLLNDKTIKNSFYEIFEITNYHVDIPSYNLNKMVHNIFEKT